MTWNERFALFTPLDAAALALMILSWIAWQRASVSLAISCVDTYEKSSVRLFSNSACGTPSRRSKKKEVFSTSRPRAASCDAEGARGRGASRGTPARCSNASTTMFMKCTNTFPRQGAPVP